MMPQFQSEVSFACPKCERDAHVVVDIPEPDWLAADDAGQLNSEGEIDIRCPHCAISFDAYVTNYARTVEIRLLEAPDTKLSCSDADFSAEEDWPEPEPSTDPADIFYDLTDEVRKLATSLAHDEDGGALMNRMLFSSLITALETYLSDTLRLTLDERPEALALLLAIDRNLVAEKFSLTQIVANPNLVKDVVAKHLKEVLYHNLPKVNAIYKAAFDIDFIKMTKPSDFAVLARAIDNRHHCIHRNGKDLEGNRLQIFTKSYIDQTRRLAEALVDRIEQALFPRPIFDDDDMIF